VESWIFLIPRLSSHPASIALKNWRSRRPGNKAKLNVGHFLCLLLLIWNTMENQGPRTSNQFQMSEQTVASGPHQTPFQRVEQTTRYFSSATDSTPPCSKNEELFSNCVSIENTSEKQSTVQGPACPTLRIGWHTRNVVNMQEM